MDNNKYNINRFNFNKKRNYQNYSNNKLTKIYHEKRIKQILIDYIYNKLNLQKFNYTILKDKEDLNLLNLNSVIMPNFVGYDSLLIFMKNNDRYYSYIVKKNTLTYQKSNINIDNIYILPVEINLDQKIYDGTIFEGICYIEENEAKYFIINDIYIFKNKPQYTELIKVKLMKMKQYLNKIISSDNIDYDINKNNIIDNINNNCSSSFKLFVNDCYDIKDIEQYFDNTKNIEYLKGFMIYSLTSGKKLIYNYNKRNNTIFGYNTKCNDNVINKNDVDTDNIMTINKSYSEIEYNKEIKKYNKNFTYTIKENINNDIKLDFIMKKTNDNDIYKLYLLVEEIDKLKNNIDNKKVYKTKFISIAYIPNIELSNLWYNNLKDSYEHIVECSYLINKQAWIPRRISENNKPSSIDDFKQYFDIT